MVIVRKTAIYVNNPVKHTKMNISSVAVRLFSSMDTIFIYYYAVFFCNVWD